MTEKEIYTQILKTLETVSDKVEALEYLLLETIRCSDKELKERIDSQVTAKWAILQTEYRGAISDCVQAFVNKLRE